MIIDLSRLSSHKASIEFDYWLSSRRIQANFPRLPPPSPSGWLICNGCGWSALLTRGRVHGGYAGETCKYSCGGVLEHATKSDMNRLYPGGVVDNTSSALMP